MRQFQTDRRNGGGLIKNTAARGLLSFSSPHETERERERGREELEPGASSPDVWQGKREEEKKEGKKKGEEIGAVSQGEVLRGRAAAVIL